MRRAGIVGAFVGLTLIAVLALPVHGQDTGAEPSHARLAGELGERVANADWGTTGRAAVRVGVHVVDLASGETVYESQPDRALNPASNAKLLVMAAALKVLAPDFTVSTTLHGEVQGDAVRGDLVLRGRGDPNLAAEDLWELTRALRARGIVRVTGGIVIDDAYFDDQRLPYAFDTQPAEDASFRAPVGAASVDANAFEIWIGPGDAAGDPARAWSWPAGFLQLTEEAETTTGSGNQLRLFATPGTDGHTAARVWGRIGAGGAWDSYERRIDDPAVYAGLALREVLREAGIAVEGSGITRGAVPDGAATLAEHVSDPLGSWLWKLGKESSNFHAEQLLRILGAERKGTPGTAEAGAEVVRETLEAWSVPVDGLVFRNGSGLFTADEVTPRTLTALLRAVYVDATIRPEFLAALAVAGQDGTAASRMRGTAAERLVRVKTGTLAGVSALSGYALSPDGRAGYAFSVLVNDVCGRIDTAKRLQDGIATQLASEWGR